MKNTKTLTLRLGKELSEQRARGDLQEWEVCNLTEVLSRQVIEMLDNLGLNNYGLSVSAAEPDEPASMFLYCLEIEDTACFGPLCTDTHASVNPVQLTKMILETLFAHRETLLARAVRDEEWKRVTSYLPSGWLPRSTFNDLVASAINRGLNVPNILNNLVALSKEALHLDDLSVQIEAIMATQAETVIRVRVEKLDSLEEDTLSNQVREKLFSETGLLFPPLEIEINGHLSAEQCQFALNRLWAPVISFDHITPAQSIVTQLRNYAPIFATTTSVDSALGQLNKAFPMVVFNTIEVFGTASVLKVLQLLLDEGVNILDLRTILGAIVETNGILPTSNADRSVFLPYEATMLAENVASVKDASNIAYTNCVRVQLKDQISQACADQNRVLNIFRTSTALEERLYRLRDDPFSEEDMFELLSAILPAGKGPAGAIVLTPSLNRRRLRDIICHEFPFLPVLCEAEISPYVTRVEAGELDVL